MTMHSVVLSSKIMYTDIDFFHLVTFIYMYIVEIFVLLNRITNCIGKGGIYTL